MTKWSICIVPQLVIPSIPLAYQIIPCSPLLVFFTSNILSGMLLVKNTNSGVGDSTLHYIPL
ncbi:hypothetical protein ACTHGU_07560 [Chitinophagaceae bacterium MMS25-I14]